jgi:cell division protein FtsZ
MADEILRAGVQGISDLIVETGLVNLDFADVKAVMQGAGTALMGIGTAKGEDRAMRAAEQAINHPLLENSIDNARGVLIQFAAASNMKLAEINNASRLIQEIVHPSANIYFGSSINDAMGDEIRVTVIAAGFDEVTPRPASRASSFTASNSGSIPVVVPTPVYEPEAVTEAAPLASVPAWFGTSDITEQQEVVEPVTQENTKFEFEPRKTSSGFDDDMDIPDFLK